MNKTYTTNSGDMWDNIAKSQLGGEEHKEHLMKRNPKYLDTYIFQGGIVLHIPDVPPTPLVRVAPWKAARL